MSRSHSNPARVWLNFIRGTRAARIFRERKHSCSGELHLTTPDDCQYLLSRISKTEQNSVVAFLSLRQPLLYMSPVWCPYSISVFLVQVSSAFMEGL